MLFKWTLIYVIFSCFRCVIRFPSTSIKIMFQSLVSTNIPTQEIPGPATMSKVLMPHPGQADHMKLASPASSTGTSMSTESSALPISHIMSPGAAVHSPAMQSIPPPRLPSSAGLRIHIPERKGFASPCPSPTGTIR